MPGIERTRFVSFVPDELTCPICLNVFTYTHTIEDDNGHSFCLSCIKEWLGKHKTCPLDNGHLDETKLRPIGFSLKGLIGRLELRCRYFSIGCDMVCRLEAMDNHERNCEFINLKCKRCHLFVTRRNLLTHACIPELLNENKALKMQIEKLEDLVLELKAEKLFEYNVNEFNAKKEALNAKKEVDRPKKKDTVKFKPMRLDRPVLTIQPAQYKNAVGAVVTAVEHKRQLQLAEDKIKCLGNRVIQYREHAKRLYEMSRFAINNTGCVAVLLYDLRSNGELMLFDYNNDLIAKKELTNINSNHLIALTNDLILITYREGNHNQLLHIDSYNFELKKINSFKRFINNLDEIYPLDTCSKDNLIYLKVPIKLTTSPLYCYMTFVLNKGLEILNSYQIKTSASLANILIKDAFMVYYVKTTPDNYHFTVRTNSIEQDCLAMFDLRIQSDIRCTLGPNTHLFVLIWNDGVINEYNLNGIILNSIKVNVAVNLKNFIFRVSDQFDFALGSYDNGDCLYLSD